MRLACRISRAAVLVTLGCAAMMVQAQSFPNGPLTIVVPVAPGDAADVAARAMGEEISRMLNTPVLAINRPGAGGAVGTQSVAQAKKDGHTIAFAPNSALTIRAVVDPQSVTYDVARDLLPLGIASRTPSVLAVRKEAPYRNLAELIDHAKKAPGRLNVGHPGAGSVAEFSLHLVNTLAGIEMVAVPHTGAAPAVVALRGGHIDGVVAALGVLSPHIKSGALRGVVTSHRMPEFADIPTLRESGYREDLFGVWFSFLAPAGIPEDARKALTGAIEQAIKTPAIAAKLAPLGIVQSYAAPAAMSAEIRDEYRRISELAKKSGIVK